MSDTGETADRRYREAQRESPAIVRPLMSVASIRSLPNGQAAIHLVDGVRLALAHNIGDPTAVSAVTMLEGPGADGE
jgi:hypothetical protein